MLKILVILISLTTYTLAVCKNSALQNTPPYITFKTQELCFETFGILYSKDYKIPLAVYEHITKDSVLKAKLIKRKDSFHVESNATEDEHTLPSDYINSGYDKGHLSNCANQPTLTSQWQSFSMANIVPQKHHNNAGIWKDYEERARNLAILWNDVYIVSGPILFGNELKIKNKITIPNKLYKAIYYNGGGKVYVFNNGENDYVEILTFRDFYIKYKINVFPSLY